MIQLPTALTFKGYASHVSPNVMFANGNIDPFELMSYDNHAAMEVALASNERVHNAANSEVPLTMVEQPAINHAVFELVASG